MVGTFGPLLPLLAPLTRPGPPNGLLDDNPRLGPQARQAITSAQGVHVSAATVWELTIKTMLGKLSVPADLSKRLAAQGLTLLSITAGHAEAIRDFTELIRHDPFDRLLVAQASRAGLQLLTADQVLVNLGHDFILDAARYRTTTGPPAGSSQLDASSTAQMPRRGRTEPILPAGNRLGRGSGR